MPDSDELIRTTDAAEIMGESVRQFIRRVERDEVKPAMKLPGLRGAYLFRRGDIESLTQTAAPAAPASTVADPLGNSGGSSSSEESAA